jgi:hypothetical protein
MLLGLILDIPFIVLTALLTHHNWGWVVLVGVAFPALFWLELVYVGWFGKHLGVDKPPPPFTWDDPTPYRLGRNETMLLSMSKGLFSWVAGKPVMSPRVRGQAPIRPSATRS